MNRDEIVAWFEKERGIRPATLDHFGVKIEDGQAVFPYSEGEKTRKFLPDGGRKFFFTPGVSPPLYNLADALQYEHVFLVEGETDTMRLWQELNDTDDNRTGVAGLSGIHTWKPAMADEFNSVKRVYVALDNDEDYNVRAAVDGAYTQIRQDLSTKARRLQFPNGIKDCCEFFDSLNLDTLRLLVQKVNGSQQSRYAPLDLTKRPPEPKWLVKGLISRGDLNLLSGPPGLGKSMLAMGLSVAVAEGHETFLGHELSGVLGGRVLYVDQENPDDVIFHRLKRLGLTTAGMSKIRYLWNQGIRLDRNPHMFQEEAQDFEPTLIVLDSLTRAHTQDENSAGAIAALFNDGIQPLARDTGAAVIIIHHDNKGGTPRGSIDIQAAVDGGLQVRSAGEDNPGKFILKQIKSRRSLSGNELVVQIEDGPDGNIRLRANAPITPPF